MGQCTYKKKEGGKDYKGTAYDGDEGVENIKLSSLRNKHSPTRKSRPNSSRDAAQQPTRNGSKMIRPTSDRVDSRAGTSQEKDRLTLDMRRKSSVKQSGEAVRSRNLPTVSTSQLTGISRFGLEPRQGSTIRRPSRLIGDPNDREQGRSTPQGRLNNRNSSTHQGTLLNNQLETIPSEESGLSGMRSTERSPQLPVLHIIAPNSGEINANLQRTASRIVNQQPPLRRFESRPPGQPQVFRPPMVSPLQPPHHLPNALPEHSLVSESQQIRRTNEALHSQTSATLSNGSLSIGPTQNAGVFVAAPMTVPPQVAIAADLIHHMKLDCGDQPETRDMRRFDYERRIQF